MFFLAYHLHWAHHDVLDLATGDRWGYLRLLSEQLEREQDEIESARVRA